MLGQANHFLITILIGLNGVRSELIRHDPEFHAAWNPKDVKASADRSRTFALDLALVRAVDSFDAFMMNSRRAPSTLGNAEFECRMDGIGQSVSGRLSVFSEFLTPLEERDEAFLRLAIAWRNRRVHSLSDNSLGESHAESLRRNAEFIASEYRGLIIAELLARFDAGEPPHFKDAASIVKVTHKAVEHFDRHLLASLDIESYVRRTIANALTDDFRVVDSSRLKHACHKVWGDPKRRMGKVTHLLTLVGIHRVDQISAREIPDELIEKITSFNAADAMSYFELAA